MKAANELKGLLLLSPGIDSPVAGKLMIDKGVNVIAVHFILLNDEREEQNIIELARKIGVNKLFFADLRQAHNAYLEKCNPRFTCVYCKRMMLRVAEKLASMENCDFLITGENLGQVASQTLDNMAVIQASVKIIVLQPLLGFDKNDIVKLARKFGTYEVSIQKKQSCPYLPLHPATTSELEKIQAEESRLNIEELVNKSVKSLKRL